MRSNYDDDGFGGPMKPQMTDSVGAQPWNTPYTAPPRKEWVGLTDEDISQWIEEEHDVLRWAEAKLRERNT